MAFRRLLAPLAVLLTFGCAGDDGRGSDTNADGTATLPTSTAPTSSAGTDSTTDATVGTDASTAGGSMSVGESDTVGSTGTTGSTTVDPTVGTDSTTTDGGDGMVIDVKIDPLDPVILVSNGVIPPATVFTATGITDKGKEVPLTGSWKYDRPDLASIGGGTGDLTATGLLGGVGKVTFASNGLSAETTATVKLYYSSDPGVDPGIKDAFDGAVDPDPALTLLYPYDKTVFPRGLIGPRIQWNGGNPNDWYYVHAVAEAFEFEGWSQVPPPSRYDFPVMPTDVWLKLTASTDGDVTLDIQRHDGNKAYLAKTQTWTIAPADLTGTVYYWEVNNGNIVKLPVGAMAPQSFVKKDGNTQCLACHSVSKDGSRIAAAAQGGWSPWTTINPATGDILYYSATASGFQAISPNGSHTLWGQSAEQGSLKLSAYNSNVVLAQLSSPGAYFVHPAWAGDTTHVAFAQRLNGNWLDFTASHLWMTEVDLNNPGFTNTVKIVDSAGGLPTVTFPTFTPDSNWVAYMRANQARTRAAVAEVWMAKTDGSAQVRLDNTNSKGIIEIGQDQTTYEPTFLPVAVGGYFWLIVGSERKYGNTLTDTNPNSRRKQLWVSAIDPNAPDGVDPSHPPFWLPGQELNNSNMRGEWALSPCKGVGEDCKGGFECCEGFCYDGDMDGDLECGMPMGCAHMGDACEVDAACCDGEGLSCIGGYCSIKPG